MHTILSKLVGMKSTHDIVVRHVEMRTWMANSSLLGCESAAALSVQSDAALMTDSSGSADTKAALSWGEADIVEDAEIFWAASVPALPDRDGKALAGVAWDADCVGKTFDGGGEGEPCEGVPPWGDIPW